MMTACLEKCKLEKSRSRVMRVFTQRNDPSWLRKSHTWLQPRMGITIQVGKGGKLSRGRVEENMGNWLHAGSVIKYIEFNGRLISLSKNRVTSTKEKTKMNLV